MKSLSIIILFTLLCCVNKKEIDINLKRTLIDYQNKFPIPKSHVANNRIYIYTAYFEKDSKDTLLKITRSSNGIDSIFLKKSGGFGIYEDDELRPTILFDNENIANKFILKKIFKIDKKHYKKNNIFIEGITPVHSYKINNGKLVLIKIDTIWQNWDK
ncbi:hypothetical protein [Flavobacterium branchiophilum]|uniref:Uncharacterized protein n=1 Tax=Flavobacterium branchiophilum TaxID=55197 RepID=A0A2H3K993_9FLAO|nr:hypothetical protein [Flavobacterium branchiophilum]PDS22682.1 hypothetical protein B0A77_12815 [Flavobacterium branchiophilum]